MDMKYLRTALCICAFLFAPVVVAQEPSKPLTNDDVLKMVKAGVPNDTILMTISNTKTAFDTTTDAIIKLNQNGVTGPVLNAMLTSGRNSSATSLAPLPPSMQDACPEKNGVYFNEGTGWKRLLQAASAGSEIKPVFGGAKSSVVYVGPTAPTTTSPHPTFCFREIKPDLGMTVVRLDQKKDHRELQTSMYSGLLTPGAGSGVKMKNIIHVTARPAENDEDVTFIQLDTPLTPGQYLILAQNPVFASMPASLPMSMRVGIGYDFEVK